MKFPATFTRYVGSAPPGGKTLGADVLPVDVNGSPIPPNQNSDDNCLFCRFNNINGWPIHRVAVVYKPPSGTLGLVGRMYFFESALGVWVQIGAQQTITPGAVSFFDCVSLLDCPNVSAMSDPNGGASNGSIAQLLIVDAGAAPTGAHRFSMGPDLSTSGIA